MHFVLRSLPFLLLPGLFHLTAAAQRPPERLAPLNQFTVGAEYSNTSSHIILGQSFNRRLAGLSLTWSRRVGRLNGIAYTWEIETRPVVLLQDPVDSDTITISLPNTPTRPFIIPIQPVQGTCSDFSTSDMLTIISPVTGLPETGTLTEARTCSTRWSYAGGLSPVGQRLNFFPRHALQPYLLANAGFLVFTHDEPVDDSSKFNFTFTFGAGLQLFRQSGAAWSVDYRVQHLSNKKIGDNNPGVDSQVFRISYTVPELHFRRPHHPR